MNDETNKPISIEQATARVEHDALLAMLPEGSEIRPYLIEDAEGSHTMMLRPANTTTSEGHFRIMYDGWLVAHLPDGHTFIVGYESQADQLWHTCRPAAENAGRESACRTLREYLTSPTDPLPEWEPMGYLPKAGHIKVRLPKGGEALTFVGGAKTLTARDAAFSCESPSAELVTDLPATPAALRVPLFHGTYVVECRPLDSELTQVIVVEQRHDSTERQIVGVVTMKTLSPAPEVVFQDYISSADINHPCRDDLNRAALDRLTVVDVAKPEAAESATA